MNIKKIIPAFAIMAGLVLAMATSGFKEADNSNTITYFYKYQLSTYAQGDIQDPNNYLRATPACSGTTNVCGVFLSFDEGTGNPPDDTDFSGESANLWLSQQNHQPASGNIVMKN